MINNYPLVTIIIPAYNCESTIAKCLDSLARLRYPHYEIIIIDDGSTDKTPQILQRYKEIRITRTENSGPSRARNIGIQKALGEFIAFTDADCIIAENWLEELLKGFVDDTVAGVGGDQQSPADETPFGRNVQDFMKTVGFVADYLKTNKEIIPTKHNPTCNVMYRKSVLLEAGFFDENLWPGEDVEMDLKIGRLGYRLYYNPDAVVRHYRPKSAEAFSRMMKRYGWAQGWLVRKYGPFRLVHFMPLFLVAGLTFLLNILRIDPFMAAGFLTAALLFGFICFTFKSSSVKRGVTFLYLLLILVFFWNLGFLQGVFEKPKR